MGRPAQEVDADQVGDVAGSGAGRHLGGCPALHDRAVLDHDHPVAERHSVEQIVGDQHVRGAGPAQNLTQQTADVGLDRDIERGQRLVKQQQLRVGHQGAGHRHTLLLPAGHRAGLGLGQAVQAQAGHRLQRLVAGGLLGGALGPQAERHVLHRAQVREQQVILEHQANRPVLRRDLDVLGGVFQDRAVQHDPAPGQRQQAHQGPQRGRFAGAVRAEQGKHLTRGDGERGVQVEPGQPQLDVGVEHGAQPPPETRRLKIMTTRLTTTSTRLSAIA